MKDRIELLRKEIEDEIAKTTGTDTLEQFRIAYLSRKGKIALLFEEMKTVSKEDKPLIGKLLNVLNKTTKQLHAEVEERLSGTQHKSDDFDITLPGRTRSIGHQHLISSTIDNITSIFQSMGFSVADGPEIETDYYNFEALNFPPDHPARDMQDTFFIDSDHLLRTHTTPVQIRVMETHRPPVRAIFPGRVFRNEVISARSHVQFHQIDGLFVDRHVTFADLKGTLVTFAKLYYGSSLKYRFRPSFFPFTEPSAEMDITCYLCGGEGCRVCKHTGWLEILGCGMVDPNVFRSMDIDPEEYTGYAFGIGIERTAMLQHGLDDIRLLFENDMRVNHQF